MGGSSVFSGKMDRHPGSALLTSRMHIPSLWLNMHPQVASSLSLPLHGGHQVSYANVIKWSLQLTSDSTSAPTSLALNY